MDEAIIGGDLRAWEELEQIASDHDGELLPEDVVDYAKDPDTALHHHFEWNNDKAAHEYRKVQARRLIRTYKIRVVESGEVRRVNYYTNVTQTNGDRSYRRTGEVLRAPDLRRQQVKGLVKELNRIAADLAVWDGDPRAVELINEAMQRLGGIPGQQPPDIEDPDDPS